MENKILIKSNVEFEKKDEKFIIECVEFKEGSSEEFKVIYYAQSDRIKIFAQINAEEFSKEVLKNKDFVYKINNIITRIKHFYRKNLKIEKCEIMQGEVDELKIKTFHYSFGCYKVFQYLKKEKKLYLKNIFFSFEGKNIEIDLEKELNEKDMDEIVNDPKCRLKIISFIEK